MPDDNRKTEARLERGMRLVVASHNRGKVWEIQQLIAPYGLDAVSAGELNLSEPEETEITFAGNARLKAVAAAVGSGLPALADDSGLEVACLGGAPGIYSARWAGPGKDFALAMEKVGQEITSRNGWTTPGPNANFTSVLSLAWPDGRSEEFEGKVHGHLVWPPRGGNGFGYDPMFVPEGDTRTFGEMEPAEKYAISHRTRAFALFKSACLDGIAHVKEPSASLQTRHNAGGVDDMAALEAAAASLSTRAELNQFLARFEVACANNDGAWKNETLPAYLAALRSVIADTNVANDDEPKWRSIALILLAASQHE